MNQFMPVSPQGAPHSIEAEQQLLGALLCNPEFIEKLGSKADPDIFHDPVHQDIFKAILKRNSAGDLVSPVAMRLWADAHPGCKELGGGQYLVRLAGASISSSSVPYYVSILAEYRAKRAIKTALDEASVMISEDGTKAAEIAARLESALIVDTVAGSDGPVSMMQAVTDAIEQADDAYHNRTTDAVLSGVPALDRILGGFYPGELILLGGRPSMGKTAVALSMALNVARSGGGVAIASLEMTPRSLAERALSEETSRQRNAVAYSSIRRGDMNEPQYKTLVEAARHVSQLPIRILPTSYRDTGALYAGVKRANSLMNGGMKLLIVDYLQLLRAQGRSRIEQIAEISIALKALSMQLNIPVLALSQLSRAVESREDKRPVLSDLRESGQLEQDADTVLFCYRHEYYLERERPDFDEDEFTAWEAAMEKAKNHLEIIVSKQRQGEIGTAHVRFNPALNLIWER